MEFSNKKNQFYVSRLYLKSRAIQGVLMSGLGTLARFGIGLLSSAILARLLTPKDFGVFEIVSAIAGIFIGLRTLGLAEATIQQEKITQEHVSGLFWINVIIGLLLFCAIAVLGPILAFLYQEPRLSLLTIFIGSTFLLTGVQVQHSALLTRQQQFGRLAIIDICGLIIGLLSGIGGAILGWGPWALAVQGVGSVFASAVTLWILMPWKPTFKLKRGIGLRPMVRFGGYVTGSRLIAIFSFRLDKLLLGLFIPITMLGQYGRAAYLAMLFQSFIVGPLEMPMRSYLARTWADDPNQAAKEYFRYLRLLIAFPLFGGLIIALIAPEVVFILFGSQWNAAGRLFSIMAVGGAVRVLHSAIFTPFISFGEGKKLFHWSLKIFLILIIVYFVMAPFGAIAMSIGYLVCSLLIIAYGLYEVVKIFKMKTELRNPENFGVVAACTVAYLVGLLLRFSSSYILGAYYNLWLGSILLIAVVSLTYVIILIFSAKSVINDTFQIAQIWIKPRVHLQMN